MVLKYEIVPNNSPLSIDSLVARWVYTRRWSVGAGIEGRRGGGVAAGVEGRRGGGVGAGVRGRTNSGVISLCSDSCLGGGRARRRS